MAKWPALAIILALCAVLPLPRAAAGELVILNWPHYLDPELVERFERLHDVRIRQILFEGDDQRDDMLVLSEGTGYDIVLASGLMLPVYARRGWIEPVTEAQVPNLRHIDPRWLSGIDGAGGYGVPYTWGTLGIGYRSDLVREPIVSWMQLFRPDPALQGRIGMLSHNRDLVGMALKALGYSANSTEPEHLDRAESLLLEQKPNVRTYGYVALSPDSSMVSGEIVASMMFNGDALMLREFEPAVEFVVPREGGNLWVDHFVVMSRSAHKGLAFAFLDFLNEPRNAAQAARFVHYATPNRAALELLPTEFLADPLIHPPEDVLERLEAYISVPPTTLRRIGGIGARVTAQEPLR